MIRIILCLIFLSNVVLADPILVLTTPKCGSHMIQKLLTMMTGEPAYFYTPIAIDPYSKPIFFHEKYVVNHPYPGLDEYIESEGKKVVLIRDPKDSIVSFVKWVEKDKKWGNWTPQPFIDFFNSLDFDKRIDLAILFPDQYMGLKFFYEQSLRWINSGAFVVKFEDLVGVQGGGDYEIQRTTISNLSEYLNIALNDEKLDYICDNLFGDKVGTFDKGLIGAWKMHFTSENKEVFDKVFGEITEKLDYPNEEVPNPANFYYDHPWLIKNIYNS